MNFSKQDYRWMAEAIRIAEKGIYSTAPNPNVGCVLVKNNRKISSGWHEKAGHAHAEINAIAGAGHRARGAICYVTLEPCCHQGKTGPCIDQLIAAGINKVYVAMQDPNPKVAGKGIQGLLDAGIGVECGLMQDEAQKLNLGFIKRMRYQLPYVRCKLGTSIDGKIALANGTSKWITSESSRRDVHKLRAKSGAIVTGINTILSDDPSLNIRNIDCKGRQALRVVMDSELRMPVKAKLLQLPGETLVFTQQANDLKHKVLPNTRIVRFAGDDEQLPLQECLHYLADKEHINDVLVESGPRLSGALLQEGLIDELILYVSGKILGHTAQSLFQLPVFDKLQQTPQFEFIDVRKIANDLRITLRPMR